MAAVVALLVQALAPAAAMAAAPGGQVTIAICTAAGLKSVQIGADAPVKKHGFGGFACLDCVFAAMAATPVSTPAAIVVRYAVAQAPEIARPAIGGLGARAPPRPPSRAPPVTLNA